MVSSPQSWSSSTPSSGLLSWLIPYPSYPPTVPLHRVVADLDAALSDPDKRPWPSHIIVVDDRRRPQGALAMACLWAWQQRQPGQTSPLTLGHCLAELEPVTPVLAQTPPAEVSRCPPPTSLPGWVVIDGEGTYLGILPRATLADQGLLTPRTTEPAAVTLAATSVQEQRWVMAISHAFKTPLTSLLGLSTLLLDHRVGSLNDRQSRYAGLMRRAIRKLIRMVNQLVDWMRLESGQLDLEVAPVDLQTLVETLLPTFLTSWLPDAATPPAWMETFRYQLPPALPSLRADRLRLQQSLYGVLGYLLYRGATPQALRLEPWGDWLGLTLRATPAEAEASASPPWTVTLGADVDSIETLGLALARRLCQHQGGDLVGFCSPQDGYWITLLLPLIRSKEGALEDDEPQGAAPPPWPTTEARGQEGRIVLLVSTDGDQLTRLQNQIGDGATRLLLATQWVAAVGLIQQFAPDLVLLDPKAAIEMPPNPLAVLAQGCFSPTRVVMVETPEASALTQAMVRGDDPTPLSPRESEPYPPSPDPTEPTDGPIPPLLTLLILTYLGRSAPAGHHATLVSPWQAALQRRPCRLVQADDLPQARLLCRVWQPQAVVLVEGQGFTQADWDWVAQSPELMQRPWVGLSPWTDPVPPGLVVVDGSDLSDQSLAGGVDRLIQSLLAMQ